MNDVIIPGWKGWNHASGRVTSEMENWMNENLKGRREVYARTRKGNALYWAVCFHSSEDAMAFKLRWI